MNAQRSTRFAIVGAGVMGRTLAWQLIRDARLQGRNLSLTLFDRDPIESGGAAAYTAAGMLAPFCESDVIDAWLFEMAQASLALWPNVVASLQTDVGFRPSGTLVVAHPGDRVDHQRFMQHLSRGASASCEWLGEVDMQQRFSELAPNFSSGLFVPGEASVDTRRYLSAIAKILTAHSVQWRSDCEVTDLCQRDGRTSLTWMHNRQQQQAVFDWVIDCRGLGARADIVDLRGVRGEIMTLHAPNVNIKTVVRLIHPRYRLYLVPRENDVYVLGATQIESEDRGPITVRSALELLSALYSLHAGFSEAQILSADVNCRPALRDNNPRVEMGESLMRINGLYRHGYLLAPILAQQVSNRLLNLERADNFGGLFVNFDGGAL